MRAYGGEPFAEVGGRWLTGEDLTGYVDRLNTLIAGAGVAENAAIGVVMRNRFPHAAAILAFVSENRSFSMIYCQQSPEAIGADIERLGLALVVADPEDWTPAVVDAARRQGSVGIAIGADRDHVTLVPGLERLGAGPFGEVIDQHGVAVLTSGTTGPPKRLHIRVPVLERAAASASPGVAVSADEPPDLVFWPFGGIGGLCQLLGAVRAGKRLVLLERFTVPEWVSAIKRHQITRVGVQPTVIRMILDANVPKEDLASLKMLHGGSGPLDPGTRDRFEEVYGIPVLWAYGATEFAGTLIAWTPELYREYGAAKRASSGRPVPGSEVRVVDPVTGTEVPPGEEGVLEARIPLIEPDWIRTTDLASIDEDGFVTLHGRGDGAIIRGGFKVLPEVVRSALVAHPAVLDAVVVGLPDRRLGELVAAVVELASGVEPLTEDALREWLRDRLPYQQVPARIKIVDRLPRTPSLKVSFEAARKLFA
ncbi:AMP-dependent synthetase [Nocardia nova]|uniref:AMP-dependent synthetase n=2 Tax=Nocardia nova TaxID=37330 RepID=A0A2S6AWG3_9NOCA|nr:AMP-dependent synthetase [Nocardia nova]PPJ39549.1 AMP-dependent synthetase [Nocardia nova]